MNILTNSLKTLGIISLMSVGFINLDVEQAHAIKMVHPTLKVEGKTYNNKDKAKSSAIDRWEKQAVIDHGMKFGNWKNAKDAKIRCNSKFHQGNGKKLWTCQARGRPLADIKACQAKKVRVKWFHSTRGGASKGAEDAWEKAAAAQYGIKYSFIKNAKDLKKDCSIRKDGKSGFQCIFGGFPCR